MKKHLHLPDPFKVNSVSKIFDEWNSDYKYKVPRANMEKINTNFSPNDELDKLTTLMQEKDSHFYSRAYDVYLKYISAHEKGVLVQTQEALKALACFRQMIISRPSSQRFSMLFSYLRSVHSVPRERKSSGSKHKLPKVPEEENKEKPEIEVKKESAEPQLPQPEKVRKHKKRSNPVVPDLVVNDQLPIPPKEFSKEPSVSEEKPNEKRIIESLDDGDVISEYSYSNRSSKHASSRGEEPKKVVKEEKKASKEEYSDSSSSSPLDNFINLLSNQSNGVVGSPILDEISQTLARYSTKIEDLKKENVFILQDIRRQIEAGFLSIESIQTLISLLNDLKDE